MKKKLIKNLLLVLTLVVLCLAVGVTASAETWGDYKYSVLENGTIEINKYIGDDTEITIPSEIDGMMVTKLGDFSPSFFVSLTLMNNICTIKIEENYGEIIYFNRTIRCWKECGDKCTCKKTW